MDIRADFLIVTQDGVLQYHVPCKGNPSCLGELLRQKILQSLGMLVIDPDKPLLDCFLNSCKDLWEKEKESTFNEIVTIHKEIEYFYIVNLNMLYPDILYCTQATKDIVKSQCNKDLIDLVCIKENVIPLEDSVKK